MIRSLLKELIEENTRNFRAFISSIFLVLLHVGIESYLNAKNGKTITANLLNSAVTAQCPLSTSKFHFT